MCKDKLGRLKRVSCDLIDDDGYVVGRAYAIHSCQNDRFIELAENTNIASRFAAQTMHFDTRDFEEDR